MEGVGFQVLEAVASGLPVITLDHAPMNEWVQRKEMLVRPRWFKRRAFPTAWIPHAFLRLPDRRDLARKMEWCATHDLTEISTQNRTWAEETFAVKRLQAVWQDALAKALP
jgi:glycosyltransferase involved in cell wall biosynthesis